MGSGSSAAIRHGIDSASAEGLRELVLRLPSEELSKLREAVEKAQGQSIALGTADLSGFFRKTYVDGGLYDGLSYTEDIVEGSQPTYRYDAPDGPVHVWRHALDLCGSHEEEDVIVLYHYTNLLGFMNVFGEMHPTSLQTKTLLAILLFKHGRPSEEAIKLGLEAVTGSLRASDGCPDEEISEQTVELIDVMAPHLLHQGRFHEALPLLQSSLKTKEAKLGSSHSITEQTRGAFANCLSYLGRWNEVEALCRERLKALQQVSPPNWEKISTMKRGLAGSLLQQLRFAEGEQLLQEALDTNRKELGKTHPESLEVIKLLAPLAQHLGRIPEAQALLEEVQEAEASAWQDLKEKRQRLGDTLNPELRQSITTLQKLLQSQGRLKEVEALMWELLKTNRADMEKGKHAFHGLDWRNGFDWLESTLLATLLAEARVPEAEHLLTEDLELKRRTLGNENMSTLNTLEQLASLLQQQGRHAEAEPLLQEAIKGKRAPYMEMRQTLEASEDR